MFWKTAHRKYAHLTAEDEDIKKYLGLSGDFQEEGYKGLVGHIQDMGHRWIAQRTPKGRVLEIGFGSGRHSLFFAGRHEDYYVTEYSERFTRSEAWNNLRTRGVRCDAKKLPFRSATFRAVISIYNLEHIADLKSVFQEVYRVLEPGGKFLIALPCEGGLLWNVGRQMTTRRVFQKQYGLNYDKIIAYEHVWDFFGVSNEIEKTGLFQIKRRQLLPFRIPTSDLNLIACLECSPVNPSTHQQYAS